MSSSPKFPFRGVLYISLGSILLAVAALGHFTSLGRYPSRPPTDAWDRLDIELAEKTRDLHSLYVEAEKRSGGSFSTLPPEQVMFALHEATARRFSSGEFAYHTLLTNWLMWVGKVSLRGAMPEFGRIAHYEPLLKYGHSALCGQVSYVLVHLARLAKIPARHVGLGLNSHVVMEAWYDNDWHLYDPYYEVVIRSPDNVVLDAMQLARQPDLVESAYRGRVPPGRAVQFFDRSLMTFATQPPYAAWHWKGGVMIILDRVAEVMKFVIPGIFVLSGAIRLVRRRRATR